MKGYKISEQNDMGFESDAQYTTNYDKAVQIWNNAVRKAIAERDCVGSEEFGEDVQNWKEDKSRCFLKEDKDRYEFLYAVAPIIVYKDKKTNKQIANVYYTYKSSYEYNEWDIAEDHVVLEEIEIVE